MMMTMMTLNSSKNNFSSSFTRSLSSLKSSSSSSKKPQQRERGRLRIVVNSGVNEEKVGIVLVDHGSRAKSSNEQLERFAEMFEMMYGSTIGGDYNSDDNNSYSKERKYEVAPAHMELASPSIADAFRELIETKNCRKIVVATIFSEPGKARERGYSAVSGRSRGRIQREIRIRVHGSGSDRFTSVDDDDYSRTRGKMFRSERERRRRVRRLRKKRCRDLVQDEESIDEEMIAM